MLREIVAFLPAEDLARLECCGREALREDAAACWDSARARCAPSPLDGVPRGSTFFAARARTTRLVPTSFDCMAHPEGYKGRSGILDELCFTVCIAWSGKVREELVVFDFLRGEWDYANHPEFRVAVPEAAPGQAFLRPWLAEALEPRAPPRPDGRIGFDQLEIHEKWYPRARLIVTRIADGAAARVADFEDLEPGICDLGHSGLHELLFDANPASGRLSLTFQRGTGLLRYFCVDMGIDAVSLLHAKLDRAKLLSLGGGYGCCYYGD